MREREINEELQQKLQAASTHTSKPGPEAGREKNDNRIMNASFEIG
jgi:hypothetical protein